MITALRLLLPSVRTIMDSHHNLQLCHHHRRWVNDLPDLLVKAVPLLKLA